MTALLRVAGAQRVEGPPPQETEAGSGHAVPSVVLLGARIWPGTIDKPLEGTLPVGSTAVSIFLVGDIAHYVLPAGPADVTAKDLPTFSARLSFSPLLPLGPIRLWISAVAQKGVYGPPSVQQLISDPEPLPQGALVFQLRWKRAADLDLHVQQPDGQVIWSRRKNALPSPGSGSPSHGSSTGYLDQDSNSLCVIDGQQREHVVYPQRPLSGLYRVWIDAFSLCKETTAFWEMSVFVDGKLISSVGGQSVQSDTRGPHEPGTGTLALEWEWK